MRFNEYGRLIHGATTLKYMVLPPWQVVFRTRWIPDDIWPDLASRIDSVNEDASPD